jgi:hypothetical protein
MRDRLSVRATKSIFLCIACMLIAKAQVVDTLYSIPQLDGYILSYYQDSTHSIDIITEQIGTGDGLNNLNNKPYYFRSYLSFNLRKLTRDTIVYKLSKVKLELYQLRSRGNGVLGQYPMFGSDNGQSPCVLDHINYDSTLDISDVIAGDIGSYKTYTNNIGKIAETADTGKKSLDVLTFVQSDLLKSRTYAQFRIRFDQKYDDDLKADDITFLSGNTFGDLTHVPKLIFYWDTIVTSAQSITIKPKKISEIKSYPNPFNDETIIELPNRRGIDFSIKIYDCIGKVVDELFPQSNYYRISWKPKGFVSGVYFAVAYEDNTMHSILKMILMR